MKLGGRYNIDDAPLYAERVQAEQAGRAKIRRATEDAKVLITLYRDASDASSLIHANFHPWIDELFTDAAHPEAARRR